MELWHALGCHANRNVTNSKIGNNGWLDSYVFAGYIDYWTLALGHVLSFQGYRIQVSEFTVAK